jgi:hypothetical protein
VTQLALEDAPAAPAVRPAPGDGLPRAKACAEVALMSALGWTEFPRWKARAMIADYPVNIDRCY